VPKGGFGLQDHEYEHFTLFVVVYYSFDRYGHEVIAEIAELIESVFPIAA
jgi:hypothetical protein